jgi:Arc/MetJ family transcription regulator
MAILNINIPDAALARVKTALGVTTNTEVAAHMRQQLRARVLDSETQKAADAARANATTQVETDFGGAA